MKKLLALSLLLSSSSAQAASGAFTWISSLHLPMAEHVATMIFVSFLLILGGFIYRSKIAKVSNVVIPDKGITFRNISELYGNFIYGQCKAILGEEEAHKYFSFIATTFLVILICNLIGLIPGFLPPTEHLSTTLALGVFSFLYYNVKGMKEQGVINYLKHFAGPLWYLAILIFPIEIISNFIRPLSLALRLRSNMMGDHLVLSIFSGLAPLVVPIIFMILGILVSFIQAYVFTVLSMVYISLATHHDHDEEHAH
ncbi:MAG: ATP synthase F0 subunit A [Halobacteriovorax sp.]|nr:ATP synthase F0 subunit A [Halobacteriovorax sp.]|tara:strand:+ start:353087 stop:353851 length:765 start_codon:yes stop_codon:yes gene_type:complete